MNIHKGGSLDAFLEEEDCLDEVSAKARKRLLTLQLSDITEQEHLTKTREEGLAITINPGCFFT